MRITRFLPGTLLFLCTGIALADQVILKNGDIITGTVVSKSGNILTFNTGYAGDIKIAWDKVSTLSTDKPVATLLEDDSYIQTDLLPSDRGNVRLSAEAAKNEGNVTAGAYGLGDILYLNPTPEESGRGYRYSGHSNLAFSNTSGNSNNQQLHLDGEIQKRARAYRYTLGGEANRASDTNNTSVSNWRTYASYDSFYTKENFRYVRGSFENDKFTDVKLRSVIGVGYGYQVYESEATKLAIKGGPDLVSIDRYVANSENFVALGWHIDFNHKLQFFPAEIFHVQDGYRGFNSGADILVKTSTGLRIPLSKGLTATAQYNFNWDSNPAPLRGGVDRQLMIGIGYLYN